MIKVTEVKLPQYTIDTEPDDKAIGKILDNEIKKYFLGQPVVVRGVASSEHPDTSVDELVEIVKQTGTDRYDPERVGDRYENIEGKHIDLFGFPSTITASTELFHAMIWGFYHSAKAVHNHPMRIDVVTIYDADQMEQVAHQYEGRDDIKNDGFVFKHPENKQAALLGIMKIH